MDERLVASLDRLTDDARTWLVGQGVPEYALDRYPGPIGATDDGMFTLPIRDEGAYSDLIGIAGWSQRDPSRFQILDGHDLKDGDVYGVFGLGQHLIDWIAYERTSIAVTATPLEWLKHWGATFCPLLWPDAAFWLMHCPQIIALPAAFGHELRRRLDQARPHLPTIRVQV